MPKNTLSHQCFLFYRLATGKDLSHTVFVMRSRSCPKSWKWDHIGFVLHNGKLKDMSGHRYDEEKGIPLPPMVQERERYRDDELFLTRVEDGNSYREYSLPFEVEVMDLVPGRNSVNCGTYVLNVINHYLEGEGKEELEVGDYKMDTILEAIKSL